ncbi:MAG: NUDIX hydrolase [Candidatus Altiarchaeota archaeon]|nr:NUDIX hydrolase [Candidatus Altiarchaeota archaeon]
MTEKNPKLTVDAVVLKENSILLVKRGNDPFKDMWALPGGFVEYGETTEEAVKREVLEETGLQVGVDEMLGVYSDPKRDPRGHTVSIVYLCSPLKGELKAGTDAKETGYFDLFDIPELAFDHKKIIEGMLERL